MPCQLNPPSATPLRPLLPGSAELQSERLLERHKLGFLSDLSPPLTGP